MNKTKRGILTVSSRRVNSRPTFFFFETLHIHTLSCLPRRYYIHTFQIKRFLPFSRQLPSRGRQLLPYGLQKTTSKWSSLPPPPPNGRGDDDRDDEPRGGKGGRQIALQIEVVWQRQDGVISVRAAPVAADRRAGPEGCGGLGPSRVRPRADERLRRRRRQRRRRPR
jgi:hypothetical protein